MADYYVYSGAVGSADGSSWANAYTTLGAAVAARSAGDRFFVSHQHSSTTETAISKTGAMTQIICVNDGATPPTTLATTAVVGAQQGLAINGDLFIRGIEFRAMLAGTSHGMTVAQTGGHMEMEFCTLDIAGGSSSSLTIGPNGGSAVHATANLRNVALEFSNTGQALYIGRGRITFMDGSVCATGTVPTTVIQMSTGSPGAGTGGLVTFAGVDFNGIGSGKTVFGASDAPVTIVLDRCKFNSAATLFGSPTDNASAELYLRGAASSNINYNSGVRKYAGTVDIDIVRYYTDVNTGGATDGVTQYSWKVAGNANARFTAPLYSEWFHKFNGTTGSTVTVTVEGLFDGSARPNDDEVWVEFLYWGDPASALATLDQTDRRGLITAAALQAAGAGAAAWTKDTAVTGWQSFKCVASLTPEKRGYISARVCVGANRTVYINPNMTFS
jgi:hypothetical protein